MKRRTWRWVTQDYDIPDRYVAVLKNARKPDLDTDWHKEPSVFVCRSVFLAIFGFAPKPGECLRVEFTGKILESKK